MATWKLSQKVTGEWRKPLYPFPNSRNALEDSLGLVAALVVSRVNNSGRFVPAEDSTTGEYPVCASHEVRNKKTRKLAASYPAGRHHDCTSHSDHYEFCRETVLL
jgi:hypothetical protein